MKLLGGQNKMISLPIWLFVCMCVFASIPLLILLYVIVGALLSFIYDIKCFKEFYDPDIKEDEKN